MGVTLLGPQRRPTVDRVVRTLDLQGPVVTITAGWQERESDDIELDEQLGGQSMNLRLYERWGDVQERDHEFVAATRLRRDELLELRHTYLIRLRHALAAVDELAPDAEEIAAVQIEMNGAETGGAPPTQLRRRSAARAAARARAIADVRRIDVEHIARLDEHNGEFVARWRPHERDIVAHHRADVARRVEDAGALAVAGGHVAVLIGLLHLFALDPPRRLPMIAWSAGAMAFTEHVVLYHDRTVHGPSEVEIYGRGLGIVANIVAAPHARDRLLLNDTHRMAVLHARFAPVRWVLLDPGARLGVGFDGELPPAAVVLGPDGRVRAQQDLAEVSA